MEVFFVVERIKNSCFDINYVLFSCPFLHNRHSFGLFCTSYYKCKNTNTNKKIENKNILSTSNDYINIVLINIKKFGNKINPHVLKKNK